MAKGRPYRCPHCGIAGKNVKKGIRRTKHIGLRQIRYCNNCNCKFTPRHQKPVE